MIYGKIVRKKWSSICHILRKQKEISHRRLNKWTPMKQRSRAQSDDRKDNSDGAEEGLISLERSEQVSQKQARKMVSFRGCPILRMEKRVRVYIVNKK